MYQYAPNCVYLLYRLKALYVSFFSNVLNGNVLSILVCLGGTSLVDIVSNVFLRGLCFSFASAVSVHNIVCNV